MRASVEDGVDRLELMCVGFVCREVAPTTVLACFQARDFCVEAVDAILSVLGDARRSDEFGVGLASFTEWALATPEGADLGAGFGQLVDRLRTRRGE